MQNLLDAAMTAARLPYPALAEEIRRLLADASVQVPERLVQPLAGGGSLFVMPACDSRIAIAKLITFTPANAGSGRAAIQGDVAVFDVATGARIGLLDGPTVTARRTAAVSLLAAQHLAPSAAGPLLVVGAGAQGRAHVEAFAQGLGVREVAIASRSAASAQALSAHARTLGLAARVVEDPHAALADCPLVVTCTPANAVVLRARPRDDAFIAAVGAFTPAMVELDAGMCRDMAQRGRVVVDTRDAQHEAGDLIQAGLDVSSFPTLGEVLRDAAPAGRGPVLFKSCGWAGWDLAAARLAVRQGEAG
ncbi:delta(1)-pyrroline-2-carboxylate reductase family protein [Caenimonas aquaedulcis]|uniref:Delta(1)-pyrroline-2-carboxylate reductase family protein n=1 Tax=Caenimonas aquaedulcis TaxID=2793270 RepID=A0A931H490_9BURK|nr:delta(1)-pyrroline-2-carboxylate reductase family protein [Caenimonas aquaedulcis]MBG9388258.1 delta(1)-pyrroline-2-carboxylate reductase family protein [Caenimonas aquaedulcis]